MARALTQFFSLPPSSQAAMATASRALGRERFGWSTIAQKHVALYRRIAGEST